MESRIITVIGGSGFLGRYVVRALAQKSYRIRVLCRDTEKASFLKPYGDVGQIAIQYGDITDPETIEKNIDGSYAVINLVGVLFEKGSQSFSDIHTTGAEKVARFAIQADVKKYIHISSLGVDRAVSSHYARTKLQGEESVLSVFPNATILRPSVVFGPEDNFYNMFASMASMFPVLPLIGGGKTMFQPVYVNDVADAVMVALHESNTAGNIYELGGPNIYSMQEILTNILEIIGKKRKFISLPFTVGSLIGLMNEALPNPMITRDQVRLLKYENTVSAGSKNFSDLGIQPTSTQLIVPDYLKRYR